MSDMKSITIRELHQQTGRWVRQRSVKKLVITDRGKPTALLIPYVDSMENPPTLRDRKLRPGYARLAGKLAPDRPAQDSTHYIAEDRTQ